MIVVPHWIDPTPNLASGVKPTLVLERELAHGTKPNGGLFNQSKVARTGEFWVAQTSVVSEPVLWTFCREGDFVRIPVSAYRSATRYASSVLAVGLEIGLAAMASLRKHTPVDPLIVHLVLGNQCTDLSPYGEDAYRCYVGIAIQTKE